MAQYVVVALIVIPCAFYAVGVFAPQLKRRAQRRLALWLAAPQRPPAVRRAGLRMMPAEQSAGCGAGCSDCNNCAPPPTGKEQPLLDLRSRSRR